MDSLSDKNWLVVGLGNPGERYAATRHNLGFMVIDRLASDEQTPVKRIECESLVGRASVRRVNIELVKPQTFMNLSGNSVSCLLRKPERSHERLIVISDDLALPLGKIRIRPRGSHGGQNGLRSIIERLGTDEFIRLRIGIMPDHPIASASDFVLQNFAKADQEVVEKVIGESAEAVRDIISDGVERAMAKWN